MKKHTSSFTLRQLFLTEGKRTNVAPQSPSEHIPRKHRSRNTACGFTAAPCTLRDQGPPAFLVSGREMKPTRPRRASGRRGARSPGPPSADSPLPAPAAPQAARGLPGIPRPAAVARDQDHFLVTSRWASWASKDLCAGNRAACAALMASKAAALRAAAWPYSCSAVR